MYWCTTRNYQAFIEVSGQPVHIEILSRPVSSGQRAIDAALHAARTYV